MGGEGGAEGAPTNHTTGTSSVEGEEVPRGSGPRVAGAGKAAVMNEEVLVWLKA